MTLSREERPGARGSVIRSCCGPACLSDLELARSQRKTRLLSIALALLAFFLVAEFGAAVWSHSLSLLADSGHMLSDVAALGLALLAAWLARQPAGAQATFGHRRVEILAALVNGVSLLVIAVWIAWQAVGRFAAPEPVLGLPMLIAAAVGLVVNGLSIQLLHPESHHDLNLRGAFLHMAADAASSVGVLLAALAVDCLNWQWADAAVSLLIACLTGLSAGPLVRESLTILMEYAPPAISPVEVEAALNAFQAVCRVEKLHIWTVTSGQVWLCAHLIVTTEAAEERDCLLQRLQAHLKQKFGLQEAILQLTAPPPLAAIPLHPLFSGNLISMFARAQEDIEHKC